MTHATASGRIIRSSEIHDGDGAFALASKNVGAVVLEVGNGRGVRLDSRTWVHPALSIITKHLVRPHASTGQHELAVQSQARRPICKLRPGPAVEAAYPKVKHKRRHPPCGQETPMRGPRVGTDFLFPKPLYPILLSLPADDVSCRARTWRTDWGRISLPLWAGTKGTTRRSRLRASMYWPKSNPALTVSRGMTSSAGSLRFAGRLDRGNGWRKALARDRWRTQRRLGRRPG